MEDTGLSTITVICLIVLMICSVVAVTPVASQKNVDTISNCTTINNSGTYELISNIQTTGDGTCIEIKERPVTILGNGYKITNPNTNGIGIGVPNPSAGEVVIKNLEINGFNRGIYYKAVPEGAITNVEIRDSNQGIYTNQGGEIIINDSRFVNNTVGVFVDRPFRYTVNHTYHRDNKWGIVMRSGSGVENYIRNNTVVNSSRSGIYVISTSFVEIDDNKVNNSFNKFAQFNAKYSIHNMTGFDNEIVYNGTMETQQPVDTQMYNVTFERGVKVNFTGGDYALKDVEPPSSDSIDGEVVMTMDVSNKTIAGVNRSVEGKGFEFKYTDEKVGNISEDSLRVLEYRDGSWNSLQEGVEYGVEQENNTVKLAINGWYTYAIVGDVSDNGDGENKSVEEVIANLDSEDGKIQFSELQTAISWWIQDKTVPGTGEEITFSKLQDLIGLWVSGEEV